MELTQLLKNVEIAHLHGEERPNITNLAQSLADVNKNSLFFCINGVNVDGHEYASDAVKKGATVLVVEYELPLNVVQVVVKNTRIAMSVIAKNFFGSACDDLKIVSVTGTNGKTSTTYIINEILKTSGIKSAIIGTNGTFVGNFKINTKLTTPDPIELHYVFQQLKNLGVEVVVMEASAHAIMLNKLVGITSEVAILTNVTEEHLDFFGDYKTYANVKKHWFEKNINSAVINTDDEVGRDLMKTIEVNTLTYGLSNPADTFAINIETSIQGSTFFVNALDNLLQVKTCLVGEYNVYNILASINACLLLKITPEKILEGLRNLSSIPGRFNVYNLDCNNVVVVDFAHTPDGFTQVLSTIRKLRNGKIITLFGCVGYSLSKKRTEMGNIAKQYSDFVIVSSDNPNFESFDEITKDITKNYSQQEYVSIENRAMAIKFGFGKMFTDDTLVILGKGVEDYNLINGVKIKSCDTSIVEKSIEDFYAVKKSKDNE